jgi:hypothetical protein
MFISQMSMDTSTVGGKVKKIMHFELQRPCAIS